MSYVNGTFCQAGSSRRPSMSMMWGGEDTPDADAVGGGSLRATYLQRREGQVWGLRLPPPQSTETCQLPLPHSHVATQPMPVATQPMPMTTQPRTVRTVHACYVLHNTHSSPSFPSTRTGKGTDRACASRHRRGHFRLKPRQRVRADRGRSYQHDGNSGYARKNQFFSLLSFF